MILTISVPKDKIIQNIKGHKIVQKARRKLVQEYYIDSESVKY